MVASHEYVYPAIVTVLGDSEAWSAAQEQHPNWIANLRILHRVGRFGACAAVLRQRWRVHDVTLTSVFSKAFAYPVPAIRIAVRYSKRAR